MRITEPSALLLEWFADEIDIGDAPELHLVGLQPNELVRCFSAIQSHGPQWSDRTFFLEEERRDVTVHERPDVASLVAARAVSVACVGARDLRIDGAVLPLVEMFLYPSAIQFFWWPGPAWTLDHTQAFLSLLAELLDLAPVAQLQVDRRYPENSRGPLRDALAEAGIPSSRLAA